MRVCVPTKNDAGMDAFIHEHFGSAPFFTLIDTDTEEVKVIGNSNSHHSHGTCHPMSQLSKFKIDAVVCRGMGRRAVDRLNADGVKTLISDATNVRGAVGQIADGVAEEINPSKACHGHGHGEHSENSGGGCDHG